MDKAQGAVRGAQGAGRKVGPCGGPAWGHIFPHRVHVYAHTVAEFQVCFGCTVTVTEGKALHSKDVKISKTLQVKPRK